MANKFLVFGVCGTDGKEAEILLNVNSIVRVYTSEGRTFIDCIDGISYASTIEYKYLVAEMCLIT